MRRREYCQQVGGAAAAGSLWWVFGDDDGTEDHSDWTLEADSDGNPVTPEYVTEVRDDLDELREFAPKLWTGHLGFHEAQRTRQDTRGQYGWTAESSEHDVIAHYYWTRYNTQRSVFSYIGIDGGPDEHYLDHEPTIVFRNPDKTVDLIVTTGGHHYGLWIDGEFGPMTEDRVSDRRTHVNLAVQRPHNHYMEAPNDVEGRFVDGYGSFGSWLDVWQRWHSNGRYDSTSGRAVADPFVFYDELRHHWWRDDTRDAWVARNIWIPMSLNEGQSRHKLRFEEE